MGKLAELLREKGIGIQIQRLTNVAGQLNILTENQDQFDDITPIDEGIILKKGKETMFVPLSAIIEVKITSI